MNRLLLAVAAAGLLVLAGCGSGTPAAKLPEITVGHVTTVSCDSTGLLVGQAAQCTADAPVAWSASAGSINSSGLFTAPVAPGKATVTARDASGGSVSFDITVRDLRIVYLTQRGTNSYGYPCYLVSSVMPDGSDAKQLDTTCASWSRPTQSIDEKMVAFAVGKLDSTSVFPATTPVEVLDHVVLKQVGAPDTSLARSLFSGDWPWDLALSPDKLKLGYQTVFGSGSGWQYPSYGVHFLSLSDSAMNSLDGWGGGTADPGSGFSWSSDSQQALYASWQMVLIAIDRSSRRVFGYGHSPSLSPDGERIAYVSGSDIYVCGVTSCSGSRVGAGTKPSWGPDSNRIVARRTYACSSGTCSELVVFDLKQQTELVINTGENITAPFWAR